MGDFVDKSTRRTNEMPPHTYQVIEMAKDKNSYKQIALFDTIEEAYDYVKENNKKLKVAMYRTTWYEGKNV